MANYFLEMGIFVLLLLVYQINAQENNEVIFKYIDFICFFYNEMISRNPIKSEDFIVFDIDYFPA